MLKIKLVVLTSLVIGVNGLLAEDNKTVDTNNTKIVNTDTNVTNNDINTTKVVNSDSNSTVENNDTNRTDTNNTISESSLIATIKNKLENPSANVNKNANANANQNPLPESKYNFIGDR